MNDILFRGFHPNENGSETITINGKKIKGEWRYWNKFGRLVDPNTLKEKPYYSKCENYDFPVYESAMLILIYETIGQFTSLPDKNGNKIFDGDILAFNVFNYNGGDTQYKGVVKWSDTEKLATRFMIWHDNENEYYGADGAFDFDWVHYQDSELEIIGNIYENPELLKE